MQVKFEYSIAISIVKNKSAVKIVKKHTNIIICLFFLGLRPGSRSHRVNKQRRASQTPEAPGANPAGEFVLVVIALTRAMQPVLAETYADLLA